VLNAHQGVLVAGDIVERNVVVGQQTLEVCRQGAEAATLAGMTHWATPVADVPDVPRPNAVSFSDVITRLAKLPPCCWRVE